MDWINYAIVVFYLLTVIGVGVYFNNKNKGTEDYLLGGRKMPFFAIGLSTMMTMLSSVSLVFVTGEVFNHGYTLFLLPLLLGWIQIPFYYLFVRFYFKIGSFTPYKYLEYRYDAKIRMVVAFFGLYGRLLYLGMVLYSSAKIFEGMFGWDAWITILVVGVTGILFTVTGGMKAVVWTEVVQFFFLLIGEISVIWVLCAGIKGGAWEAVACAFREGHGVPQYCEADFYKITPYVRLLFFLLLWNAIVGPLNNCSSNQIYLQRLLSTANWKEGLKAQIVSYVTSLWFQLMLAFIAFGLFTYYFQNPDPRLQGLKGAAGDVVFFHFIATKLVTPFPGIFMAAMLAAIMSTLDASMHSLATVWVKEFHVKLINRNMDQTREVLVSKLATLLIGLFSITLGIALSLSGKWLHQSIAEVTTIFAVFAEATLPAFLFAMLSRRANAKLIWGYTFFAVGEAIGKNLWYILSKSSLEAWNLDPAAGFGWAGKLPFLFVAVPLLIGIALGAPYLVKRIRQLRWGIVSGIASLVFFGITLAMLQWFVFSNLEISDKPMARSFAFFLPLALLISAVVLRFLPVQPREKWQGLTIFSIGEEIISNKKMQE